MRTTQASAGVIVGNHENVGWFNNGDDSAYKRGSKKKLIANVRGWLPIREQGE